MLRHAFAPSLEFLLPLRFRLGFFKDGADLGKIGLDLVFQSFDRGKGDRTPYSVDPIQTEQFSI
jgi:hypothetical protein